MRYIFWVFPLFLIFSLSNCKTSKVIKLTDTQQAVFLDSAAAAKAIIIDKKEGFFKKINKLDMGVQMGKNFSETMPRGAAVAEYKEFVKKDMTSFSKKERAVIAKCMKRATDLCNKINPTIVPAKIELLKTNAKHYGEGAWYTRENRIIIPYDVLKTEGKKSGEVEDALTQTILHEIFHIFSRYNAEKRMQLYALIGFKNIGVIPLQMKDGLKERVLLNPDGVNMAQVIDLQTDSSVISAIPVLTAAETEYTEAKPDFFSYLKFDLFQVVRGRGGIQVISNDDGTSTLDLKNLSDFFRKIGDNTKYIIHPDEILADNFMFLALSQKDKKGLEKFSKEGQNLIQKVDDVLRGRTLKP